MVEGGCGLLTYPLDNFKMKKSVGWTCGRSWFVNVITLPKWARWSFRCLAGWHLGPGSSPLWPALTPSLPQPVKYTVWKMHGHTCKLYISAPIPSTFSAMCFDENPFTCQCEKEDKSSQRFQILPFDWLFSSDIMAVKGLIVGFKIVTCGLFLSASCYNNSYSFLAKN